MFSAERQHPVAAVSKVLDIIKGNFISLLLLLFVTSGESMVSLFGILSVLGVLLVSGVLSWLRFTYSVVDGELRIEQGVLVRKNIYLSKERIQVIDIKAGILQRMFGLVEVEVKTAGSSSKAAKISAISLEKAEQLKASLRTSHKEETLDREQEETELKRIELSARDLVVTSFTSGSFGIALSIIGTLFSQLDQVLSEEEMLYYLERIIPASLSTNMVLYSIVLVVLLSWLLSFLGTLIKYFGFTLRVSNKDLIIRQGLFEQRQLTIPFNRIQAIQIKEGLLRQPLGYASIILESAGYGEKEGNSTTLYPLIRKSKVQEFLQEVVPEFANPVFQSKPPRRALRRYLFRMILVSMIVIIPAWFYLPYGEYAISLLLPAILLGYAQYRDAAIGTSKDALTIRSRDFARTTAIIQIKRIQRVSLKQNPIQKHRDLVNFIVTVASGSQGRSFDIRELEEATAGRYFNWVSPDDIPQVATDAETHEPEFPET
ncbi:PH domain-containing protein [Balneolaceae bacterium YR4-1]|uniref:PH domain-containing protein n=1 Tax=Halalkalibaculum roseum TaxID=2709311 RepID=A0A6M1SXD7_9BACT|nr:PH domain-containing protein [Halalkalibaculum roseum]NGP75774.1 PH domain-containing protein [Halalkalibaculum roseum]